METRQLEIAQKTFNLRKATELESINLEGKRRKEKLEGLRNENTKLEREIATLQGQVAEIEGKITDAEKKVAPLEARSETYQNDPTYLECQKHKQILESEITDLRAGNTGAVETIKQEIQDIDNQISGCEATIAQINQREKGLARIEELKAQERKLAAEYEKLESQLFVLEKFTRTKVALLEDKVNAMFGLTRWKLFEELIHGGIAEVCEATYEGVPYPSLNHGSQVNVGLDVIRTLQKHHSFYPPVWIDRRESVSKIIPMPCQVISLIVSEQDKSLRIETN